MATPSSVTCSPERWTSPETAAVLPSAASTFFQSISAALASPGKAIAAASIKSVRFRFIVSLLYLPQSFDQCPSNDPHEPQHNSGRAGAGQHGQHAQVEAEDRGRGGNGQNKRGNIDAG